MILLTAALQLVVGVLCVYFLARIVTELRAVRWWVKAGHARLKMLSEPDRPPRARGRSKAAPAPPAGTPGEG